MDPSKYRLIVTSGPTREWIDPVRYITNPSSGKTGWAIAKKGLSQFREVVLISGPGDPKYRAVNDAKNIAVDTTEEMAKAVKENICENSILIMSAAPADFKSMSVHKSKIKKDKIKKQIIELKPTIDILKSVKNVKLNNFYRIGFAAETDHVESYARKKLIDKNLHYICANQVYKENMGFGNNDNRLLVFGRDESVFEIGPGEKTKNATKLLTYLIKTIQD